MDHPAHVPRIVDLDFLINKLRFAGRAEISPERFAKAFGYDLFTLEQLAHVDQPHAQSWQLSPRLQSFMEQALKVIGSTALLLADVEEAKTWFKSYRFEEFGGKTPEQLVSDGQHRYLLKKLSIGAAHRSPIPSDPFVVHSPSTSHSSQSISGSVPDHR